ncbi:formyl transferase [delta proteobacterium NaphS2]|nr:formyl transferase [delta proteobacterium NaphS2]
MLSITVSRYTVLTIIISEPNKGSHSEELVRRCHFFNGKGILIGKEFRSPSGIQLLRDLNLDLILGIHFPYIMPKEVLAVPRIGVLNLHPAYLPYNRGWHTPSWAILDRNPIGATLHFMDSGIDTGDIVHQKKLAVSPGDTANTLYRRLKSLEFEVFVEAWDQIKTLSFQRLPQRIDEGTLHRRDELFRPEIQKIDLEENVNAGRLLQKLRALTTDRLNEAAYYEVNRKKYRIQLTIQEDDSI